MAPAVAFAELSDDSAASRVILLICGAFAAALAVALLARAIHVRRLELRHERHVEAFWNRKLKDGGIGMWLLMAFQLAFLIAAVVIIGHSTD